MVYPVYQVRLDALFYNDQNDRIATWISRYESENGKESLSDLNVEIYNRIIENSITESNPEAIQKTQKNIALVGQREPGVTLADGRIVDGNRRFTCLRRIQRDSAAPVYFETVIMDMDIRADRKQIKLLAEQKLEYVDFRCYRLYERFETFLAQCDAIDDRAKKILQQRLQGSTLEEIGQEYGVTRERIRQIIKKKTGEVRNFYAMATGDRWFDEDYYWYFYETYAFDRREASAWMGIPETVWKYLDMMDVKQGKKAPESALDDSENLEIGLRLKVKNYLNRNKIFVDGVWVENKRGELEPIIAKKFCRNEISFDAFAKVFNDFLAEEEIPYDEELYYTEAVARTRKNRLADSRFILWKQNEMLRYDDIDSRDYTELLETLKLDTYENVEYSTMKFVKEYPQLMEKYDIRDHYELHNLLRKIVPEGSFHAFRCGRTPVIEFGVFDRDSAILDLKSLRQRLTYVVLFSNKLMEMKRNLDIIEFDPGQILNFRKLSRAGITKEDIRQFCDAVYNFIPENSYFTAQSLKADGFESDLYDLGFSDWFYANVDLYYRDLEEGGF